MGKAFHDCAQRRIRSGGEAVELFAALLPDSDSEERLVILFLDAEGRVLGLFERAGTLDSVDLPIRQIVADALTHDAHGLLMAHNHPSGDPTPTAADVEATRKLAAVMLPLGLRLHDHLIRAANEWRSLMAMQLL